VLSQEQKHDLIVDSIDHLMCYANDLRNQGYQGNTEADDNADYVLAHVQQLKEAFHVSENEITVKEEE
jgi:uncharacterized protein YeaC (DUF1315 family)